MKKAATSEIREMLSLPGLVIPVLRARCKQCAHDRGSWSRSLYKRPPRQSLNGGRRARDKRNARIYNALSIQVLSGESQWFPVHCSRPIQTKRPTIESDRPAGGHYPRHGDRNRWKNAQQIDFGRGAAHELSRSARRNFLNARRAEGQMATLRGGVGSIIVLCR